MVDFLMVFCLIVSGLMVLRLMVTPYAWDMSQTANSRSLHRGATNLEFPGVIFAFHLMRYSK